MNSDQILGFTLSALTYAAIAFFFAGIFLKMGMVLKAARSYGAPCRNCRPIVRPSCRAAIGAAGDIFFLTRLLRANDVLWAGEWLFHFSFLFVLLRHLRFLLEPVPSWVAFIQPAGVVAGYLLPAALIYILIYKLAAERSYSPLYNLFLLILIFLLSSTGIILSTIARADLIAVKAFALGILHFAPQPFPGSPVLLLHFLLFTILVFSLPTHIIAAPLVMLEFREREECSARILHNDDKQKPRGQTGE